ncbi:unnamed protein product [Caenorhabditis auriculariae]|uniref:Uncharacterized protein n=1 Tax=Caenorhabditis auriculariae TaxID=2777116 RepID=A0A8S1HHI9_9PELO|nr:unnamed protein product [Caenorhabditis auriculariae]
MCVVRSIRSRESEAAPTARSTASRETLTQKTTELISAATTPETSSQESSGFLSFIFYCSVHVWVLPRWVSQSHLGGRRELSSACTLIALQVSRDLQRIRYRLPTLASSLEKGIELPEKLLRALTDAIVDANETHGEQMQMRKAKFFSRKEDTFTIPDALNVHCPEMTEIDYKTYSGGAMSEVLAFAIRCAVENCGQKLNRRLVCMVIISMQRAICCVVDRAANSVCVVDSHFHYKASSGAMILSANLNKLESLTTVVEKLIFPEIGTSYRGPMFFEISCVVTPTAEDPKPAKMRGKIFKSYKALNYDSGYESSD